jgi:hypothetical protein
MHRADIASHLIYGEDLLMSVRPCKYCTSPSELSGRAGLSVAHLYVHGVQNPPPPPGRKGAARVAAAYQVSWSLFIAGSLSSSLSNKGHYCFINTGYLHCEMHLGWQV